jgi:UDP-perosamine 4-acetyltransferase
MAASCLILGGGGHARVLIDALRAARPDLRLAILDRDPGRIGAELLGVPVIGGDDQLDVARGAGFCSFVVGLGGVGDNRPRQRLFEAALAKELAPLAVVHPRAVVSPAATIGAGSVVFAGAVVNAGASVGCNAIVNTGAIVEHDCRIGDHAHLATGSRLSGTVEVGDLAHVGAGATVRQGLRIGAAALVGAGAVVVADVADGITVVGVPARPMRRRS